MSAVIFLMGPTATGKTHWAIHLAQQLPLDIISVDSTMVYRGLDIGSAKPSKAEQALAPHHLIDCCDPNESYSAGRFCEEALALIQKSHANARIPLLVGGTALYFNLLNQGFDQLPPTDPSIRALVQKDLLALGSIKLHEKLATFDKEMAKKLHPHDQQRISRAVEIYLATGKTMTAWQKEQTLQVLPYKIIPIVLMPLTREELHQRIALRFSNMLKEGFIEEVVLLRKNPQLHAALPSMRSVGYRQVWDYLEGAYDINTLKEKGIAATRQLAKRQITWLRRWDAQYWVNYLDEKACQLAFEKIQEIV